MIMANALFVKLSFFLALIISATLMGAVNAKEACPCKKVEVTAGDLVRCGIGAGAAIIAVPAAVAAAGFGVTGVAAGSLAAGFQSVFGITFGFSALQSFGAAGMGMAAKAVVGGLGCSTVIAAYSGLCDC